MDITLRVDDDLFAIFKAEALERKMTPGAVIRERLGRAVALDPRERGVVLSGGRTLHLIEQHLGGGDLKGAEDLLEKVRKLASVRLKSPDLGDTSGGEPFGDRYFQLTTGQLQELVHRSAKTGRTLDQLVEEIWRRVGEDFFRYVP